MVLVALPALAGPDITAIQSKLKEMGLYYGKADGSWGDETSAAVTRYQIRQGLEINGRLTSETLESLGLAEDGTPPNEEQTRGDAWKILREQEATSIEDVTPTLEPEAGVTFEEPPQKNTIVSVPSLPSKSSQIVPEKAQTPRPAPPTRAETPSPSAPRPSPEEAPPPQAEAVPPRAVAVPPSEVPEPPRAVAVPPQEVAQSPRAVAASQPQQSLGTVTEDQLTDYLGAYVLAGLAPSVEPELQFFADKVDYFGKRGVSKEVIRRDLEQYNAQYPQRRFWLAGYPQIQSQTDETIRVDFPLRFEVSGSSGSKSGKVLKSIELRKTGRFLEITAVDEKRMN